LIRPRVEKGVLVWAKVSVVQIVQSQHIIIQHYFINVDD